MQHYEQKFDNALTYLQSPGIMNPAGDKPICYITYDVEDVFEIRSLIDTSLIPKATYYGFHPHVISIGDIIRQFVNENEFKDIFWVDENSEEALFDSIRTDIIQKKYVEDKLVEIQSGLAGETKPLLIIKDLELLHPYAKIGAIENSIYNQISIPIIILYPGDAQGTARTFLNIYSMDGNYRSKNF